MGLSSDSWLLMSVLYLWRVAYFLCNLFCNRKVWKFMFIFQYVRAVHINITDIMRQPDSYQELLYTWRFSVRLIGFPCVPDCCSSDCVHRKVVLTLYAVKIGKLWKSILFSRFLTHSEWKEDFWNSVVWASVEGAALSWLFERVPVEIWKKQKGW